MVARDGRGASVSGVVGRSGRPPRKGRIPP